MTKKVYGVFYGDKHFKLAPDSYFIAELTDDNRIIETSYNADISEWSNYEDVGNRTFDSIAEAKKYIKAQK